MVGSWLNHGWIMVGSWLDHGWIMVGSWLDHGWFMVRSWLDHGKLKHNNRRMMEVALIGIVISALAYVSINTAGHCVRWNKNG